MNLTEGYYFWMFLLFVFLLTIEYIISKTVAALDNLSETEIKENLKEQKKVQAAFQILEKLQQENNLLLGVLTSINIIMGIVYGNILYSISQYILKSLNVKQLEFLWNALIEIILVFVVTYIIIFIGNIFPRKLALRNSKNIVSRNIIFLNNFLKLWKPFGFIIRKSVHCILCCMRIKPEEVEGNLTEDEIISVVNEGLEQGVLEDSEVEMISNIIEFDEKEVKDIMTHRKKIIALNSIMTVEEALKFILETTYSRFPIYEDDIDNIVGILYLKDITKYYVTHQTKEDKQVSVIKLAKPPYLVPDTQGIDILFHDMQLKNIHMAVAIDEYGQTAGIIAMEDILEEIVGNISDEFDVEEKMIIRQNEERYFIKGLAPLEEIENELGIDMEEEQQDYETLNGLLISLLGHIPEDNERATVEYKGYLFHIIDVENKMIHYVRVVRKD